MPSPVAIRNQYPDTYGKKQKPMIKRKKKKRPVIKKKRITH